MKTSDQLQNDGMEALRWDPTVTAADIGVAVENGVVTVSGTSPCYAEKCSAERATRRESGGRGDR